MILTKPVQVLFNQFFFMLYPAHDDDQLQINKFDELGTSIHRSFAVCLGYALR